MKASKQKVLGGTLQDVIGVVQVESVCTSAGDLRSSGFSHVDCLVSVL